MKTQKTHKGKNAEHWLKGAKVCEDQVESFRIYTDGFTHLISSYLDGDSEIGHRTLGILPLAPSAMETCLICNYKANLILKRLVEIQVEKTVAKINEQN